MATNTNQPTMQAITAAATKALQGWQASTPVVPRSMPANSVYTFGKPANPGAGSQGNNLHWAGIAQVLQATGGNATAAQLLQGSIAGNPGNIGNAAPFLGYAYRRGWLAPAKQASK